MQCNRLPRILIEGACKFVSMHFYSLVKSKPHRSKSQWDATSLPLGWLSQRAMPTSCPHNSSEETFAQQSYRRRKQLYPAWHGKFQLPSLPFGISSPFQKAHLSVQAHIVSTLQKQPSSASPGASSKDLPFLCAASLVLEHKLNNICLEISLGFTLNFYLGELNNTNAGNNSTSRYISKSPEGRDSNNTCTLVFIAALFTKAKRWINKGEILIHAITCMKLENIKFKWNNLDTNR